MTREDMLEKMSSQELTDWMAFHILRNEELEQQRKEAALNRR